MRDRAGNGKVKAFPEGFLPGTFLCSGMYRIYMIQVQGCNDLIKEIHSFLKCIQQHHLKLRTQDVMEKFLPATGHTAKVVHLVGED